MIDSALVYGRNGLGCVVVFASGNQNVECNYPGSCNPGIVVVGAIQQDGTRWLESSNNVGSNFGSSLDIVAPGDDIYLAYSLDTNTYVVGRGTSFAAPQVSAVAAMILSVAPQLTSKKVTELIMKNAKKVGPLTYSYNYSHRGYWNNQYGCGLLDAYNSLVTDYSSVNSDEQEIDGCFVNVCNAMVSGRLEINTYTRAQFSGLLYVPSNDFFSVNAFSDY